MSLRAHSESEFREHVQRARSERAAALSESTFRVSLRAHSESTFRNHLQRERRALSESTFREHFHRAQSTFRVSGTTFRENFSE